MVKKEKNGGKEERRQTRTSHCVGDIWEGLGEGPRLGVFCRLRDLGGLDAACRDSLDLVKVRLFSIFLAGNSN